MIRFESVLPNHEYNSVQTDHPLEEIWSLLLVLSDVRYLSRNFPGKTEDEYLYCTTCISQAREYHLASKVVSLKTKPLLIYYSFLNLAKAVLLLLTGNDTDGYHGLCKPEIGPDLPDFLVKVNRGVFYSLAELQGVTFQINQALTLKTLIENSIELYRSYEHYFEKRSLMVCPSVAIYMDGDIEIRFSKSQMDSIQDLEEKIKGVNGIEADFSVKIEEEDLVLRNIEKFESNSDESHKKAVDLIAKHFTFSTVSDSNAYLNLNDNKLPQATVYYGIMFILGTIVRYTPAHLHKLLDKPDTSVRWFFSKLCDTSERVYPNLMLNILYKKTIKFSA